MTQSGSWLSPLATAVAFIGLSLSSLAAQDDGDDKPIEIKELQRVEKVDFVKEVLPIFRRNCLACHNGAKAESDLVLETPQSILKGGSDGPAVVAGKSGESLLLALASRQQESYMPPDGNDVGAKRLTPDELGLLKLWIDQGAEGSVSASAAAIHWQPLPPGLNPILAAALTEDGDYAAAGRANQVFLYHVPSKRELGRLTDPLVVESGGYQHAGVAHLDLVQSLAFSPDGNWLASGGFRVAKLWRKTGLEPLHQLQVGAWETVDLAVSPDARLAAVADNQGQIHLFDMAPSGALAARRQWKAADSGVRSLCFTPDGQRLIAATADNQLQWWSLDADSPLGSVATPAAVLDLTVAGQYAAAACDDKIVRLWPVDVPSAESPPAAVELTGHAQEVFALAKVDDSTLLSASRDGDVRRWSLSETKQTGQYNHGGPLVALAAHGATDRLATAGTDKVVRLWSLQEGKKLAELQGDFRLKLAEEAAARREALAKRRIDLAEADLKTAQERKKSEEENQKKADEASTKATEELQAKTEAAKQPIADKEAADKALSEDQVQVEATQKQQTAADEALKQSDAQLQQAQAALEAARKALTAAEDMAKQAAKTQAEAAQTKADVDKKLAELQQKLKADEEQAKKLAEPAKKATDERDAAQRNQEAAQRAAERAKQSVERIAATIPEFEKAKETEVESHQNATQQLEQSTQSFGSSVLEAATLAFLDDGRTLGAVLGGKLVTWDAAAGANLEVYGAADSIRRVAAMAGPLAVTVDADGLSCRTSAVHWELARVIGDVADPSQLVDRVTALAFHPEQPWLAIGSGEPSRSGQITFWDIDTGALIRELKDPHSDTVFNLSFSRDGQRLASCAADRFVKVFQVSSGELIRSFEGHTHHVLDVAFNADGRQLASSGADKVVKIWDALTGDQKRTITGFSKEVTSLDFVGDSQNVLVGVGDKNVHIKNADNGGNVRSFGGATDYVYAVASASDGKTIIAGGQDSVLRIWNDQGQLQAEFSPPPAAGPAD